MPPSSSLGPSEKFDTNGLLPPWQPEQLTCSPLDSWVLGAQHLFGPASVWEVHCLRFPQRQRVGRQVKQAHRHPGHGYLDKAGRGRGHHRLAEAGRAGSMSALDESLVIM